MEPDKDLINEADIGSGEKSQGQKDTEKMIEQVGKDRPQPGQQTGQQPGQHSDQSPAAPSIDKASQTGQPTPGQ